MKSKNLAIMIVLTVLISGFTGQGVWIIDSQSRLTIKGFTNVNNFSCTIEYYPGSDTLQYVEKASTKELLFTRSLMTIPIRSFDCGAHPISKDFWQTLKAEKYPDMKINFISLENLYGSTKGVKGVVDITLAGVTARYTICYEAVVDENGTVLLTGMHAVNFSDFQLQAPEKLNGLIRVKEGLRVYFNLVLKEV